MSERWETLCLGCFQDLGQAEICPHCGHRDAPGQSPLALPPRTLLHGQYLIAGILGKPGGFGITYLAYDTKLETRVAVKEYLPRDLAGREAGKTAVLAHSRDEAELFRFGLEQFQKEARTLAKFDHAHIVRVRHVFEENGTAYLVMDCYEGLTLAEYLEQKGRLPEQTALALLNPILDGLREVHGLGFIHRDIKPQNIYLTTQGRPILLDFGAARLAMAERSRSLSVVLSAGYAPFEQYQRKGHQGPWTDVYACAAVLYQMLTGEPPPESTERVDEDPLVPPGKLAPSLSAQAAKAIEKGLAMNAKARFQDIRSFQEALAYKPAAEPPPPPIDKTGVDPNVSAPPARPGLWLAYGLAGLLLVLLVLAGWHYLDKQEQERVALQARLDEEAEARRQEEEKRQAQDQKMLDMENRLRYQQEATAEREEAAKEKQRQLERERREIESQARRPPPANPGMGNANTLWFSDWGSGIVGMVTNQPCADNEFSSEGYRYQMYSSIPIERLKHSSDAWKITGDRAWTIEGCWFTKDDGLLHTKTRRKKDNKIGELDINMADGTWIRKD